MIFGFLQLLLVASALGNHDPLVHHLFLIVTLAVQVPDLVNLDLPLELRKTARSLLIVIIEVVRNIVVDAELRSGTLIAVVASGREGETASSVSRGKIRGHCQQYQDEEWQCLPKLCTRRLAVILGILLPPSMMVMELDSTTEEGREEVLGCHEVLLVLLPMMLRHLLLITIPIVDVFFLLVSEALHSLRELLEGFLSAWRLVLVRMQL
mmetsp:Transcript_102781/g.219838  ORF Transcript_102781/g.219838 Transcript_102781/m.219838 type:complete len:209 (+) Transcript_102781:148-774(+)